METRMPSQPDTHLQSTDLDLDALRAYLTEHTDLAPGELTAQLIAGGRSNPTYVVADPTREWVLRRPPHGLVLETAHDMGREHTVLSALTGTAVPVPVPVALCHDASVLGAPFYMMDRLVGRTLRDRAATEAMTVDERRRLASAMVDLLVTLHEVDPATVGLGDWGRPDGYLSRQLRRWRKQWDAAHSHESDTIDELFDLLTASLPDTKYPGIVHGDFKVDNVMVSVDDPGTVVGLLDWEMSTLGDTLADVGLLISFWDEPGRVFNPLTQGVTAFDGFPSADEILDQYVQRRGIERAEIRWYVAFADLKIAIILEGMYVRHQAGQTLGEGFDGIGEMVQPLLDRALTTMRSVDATAATT
jgi:aminoglycoside phosphotransferase (APT) family kinase protein